MLATKITSNSKVTCELWAKCSISQVTSRAATALHQHLLCDLMGWGQSCCSFAVLCRTKHSLCIVVEICTNALPAVPHGISLGPWPMSTMARIPIRIRSLASLGIWAAPGPEARAGRRGPCAAALPSAVRVADASPVLGPNSHTPPPGAH